MVNNTPIGDKLASQCSASWVITGVLAAVFSIKMCVTLLRREKGFLPFVKCQQSHYFLPDHCRRVCFGGSFSLDAQSPSDTGVRLTRLAVLHLERCKMSNAVSFLQTLSQCLCSDLRQCSVIIVQRLHEKSCYCFSSGKPAVQRSISGIFRRERCQFNHYDYE